MDITPDRQVRILLEETRDLLDQAATSMTEIHAALYSPASPSLTGGAPGQAWDALPFGLDAVTDDWEQGAVRTPGGCLDILTEVADEWAEELGYAAPAPGDVVDWLADTTEHAYNYLSDDAWQATTGEIRRVYGIAQRLAGLDPIITGHTCPNDGGRLARYPLEDGFTDWELCPACGTPWTPDAYAQAVKRFLDDRSTSGPD